MAQSSFDVVSDFDKAEMNNAFEQTLRELAGRYDFKGTPAAMEWLDDKKGVQIIGNGEWQIDAILDILRKKLAARGISQKVLDTSKDVLENNLQSRKDVPFVQGLDQDRAKKVTKYLKEHLPKLKTQVQGDAVRVMSPKRDELQAAIAELKQADFDFPLSFTNYR